MALVSDVRAHLQRLQVAGSVLWAERSTFDHEPLRRLLFAAIAEDDTRPHRMDWRSRDRLLSHGDALIFEIVQQLADLPGASSREELPRIASIALFEVLCDHFNARRRDGPAPRASANRNAASSTEPEETHG